ncbi:MAG: zeta toxin family protein [Prevotella sp.]|nr:zeta toxin family protein [Prevotella sp.]
MMTNEHNQNIRDLYALDTAQVQKIKETIISVLAKDIVPSKQPLAIVVGGQSGAGKTALINYTTQLSHKREFIQIDNDFFRGFHPQVDEIKKNYPDDYVTATDQLGLGITADIIAYFRDHNYNIILHQTLKNNRVVDDAITKFIAAGYTVGVRAFAVPYFESKMSQIERCEGQIESLGFCRHVSPQEHDTAIAGLPQTIDYIEQARKYDFIEIFKRGEYIGQPELVYARFNPATKGRTLEALRDCENVSYVDQFSGFASAKDAVETTRANEARKCVITLPERIRRAEQSQFNNAEMQTHIDEIKARLRTYQTTQTATHKLTKLALATPAHTLPNHSLERELR